MDETGARPAWYHWALLVLCAAVLLTLGTSMLLGGSDTASRFRAIDDPLVRALGVALFISAPALLFRWRWAFNASIGLLAAMILETAVTYDPVASSVPISEMVLWTIVMIGLPIPVLWWLRGVIAPRKG